ncbi:MAG: nucleotidyltransferase domain-containing protein [Candidatus Bathyarchaeia archaeon]
MELVSKRLYESKIQIETNSWLLRKMVVKLKGINRIARFRRVAADFASQIAAHKGVAGILFLGGLARGFADEFSDLDVLVLLKNRDEDLKRKLVGIWRDAERRHRIEIDFEIHFIEDFKAYSWDDADRWEFLKAKIVFDPEGEAKKVLDEKLKVSENFWKKRVVVCAEYLKWYCCPVRKGSSTVAEVWIKRGDLTSAHYCLNYGVELLIRLIFALNKEFWPAPKWRLFHSYSLKWLPKNYSRLIREALGTGELSLMDFERRLRALQVLGREVFRKIEEDMGLDADLISKFYVEKVLRQDWAASRR